MDEGGQKGDGEERWGDSALWGQNEAARWRERRCHHIEKAQPDGVTSVWYFDDRADKGVGEEEDGRKRGYAVGEERGGAGMNQ